MFHLIMHGGDKCSEKIEEEGEMLMGDYSSWNGTARAEKYRSPVSFPRLFTGIALKNFAETSDGIISPTSTLDAKYLSGLKTPIRHDLNYTRKAAQFECKRLWNKLDSKGIADALRDELADAGLSKTESRVVLFGSQLKVQIPPLTALFVSPTESPKSPAEFGDQTKSSHSGSFYSELSPPIPKSSLGSDHSSTDTATSPLLVNGGLSVREMELSEDYTCVISHGPNPRTTHIFDNCIIGSYRGAVLPALRRERNDRFFSTRSSHPSTSFNSFLSYCHACKKRLGQGNDIYIYRGEKAFCSRECRYQEIMLEEQLHKLDPGYSDAASPLLH